MIERLATWIGRKVGGELPRSALHDVYVWCVEIPGVRRAFVADGRRCLRIVRWVRPHAIAVTLGRCVLVDPEKLTRRLLRHEGEHVRQWVEYPWTFPFRYLWQHIRHGYKGNRYEVLAERAERRHFRDPPAHG